jgi:DNA polymerase-3 subunit alpha/error-prone DNA polymerase
MLRLVQNAERHLRSLPEICALWADRVDLVEKTVDISARVNFSLNEIRYRYPRSNLPENRTPSEHLRFLVEEGCKWRFPEGVSSRIQKIIDHELELIKDLEYEDYFLTLREICEFADRRGILYQGRGSAANSIVCYCIGLTSVNPEEIDVLFERFISRERREPPDIDIDFEHSRREGQKSLLPNERHDC